MKQSKHCICRSENNLKHLQSKHYAVIYTATALHTSEASVPHQVVVSMFGAEHAGHFFEVGTVALFFNAAWEGHRYYPLCDVHQVHLIVLLHCMDQTHAPAGQRAHGGINREIREKVKYGEERQTVDKLGKKGNHAIKPEI